MPHVSSQLMFTELTQLVEVVGEADVLPPVIKGQYPIYLAVGQIDNAIELVMGRGESIDVLPTHVTTSVQPVTPIGVGEHVKILTETTASVTLRWYLPHPIRPYPVSLTNRTITVNLTTSELTLQIPSRAVSLVITAVEDNDITYRLDNGVSDGGPITLDRTLVSSSYQFNMPINTGHRLRIASAAGTAVLQGYWVLFNDL